MDSWGRWLLYLIAALVGLFLGGIFGRRLGEAMQKHHILETHDREYWKDVLGVMFASMGVGGGLLVVSRIFGR